jgi:hypothetical protein
MWKRMLSILTLILLMTPSHGLAQAASGDWATVRAVPAGTKLTVELKSGKRENGKVIRTSDTGVTLQNGKQEKEIPLDDVRRVHRVAGSSAGKSTLIGTGAGAAGGATIGAVSGCDRGCWFDKGDLAAAGAVVGAGFGALGGFLFGKLKSKRALIYEAGR